MPWLFGEWPSGHIDMTKRSQIYDQAITATWSAVTYIIIYYDQSSHSYMTRRSQLYDKEVTAIWPSGHSYMTKRSHLNGQELNTQRARIASTKNWRSLEVQTAVYMKSERHSGKSCVCQGVLVFSPKASTHLPFIKVVNELLQLANISL